MRSATRTWDGRSWAEERAISASAPAVVARADGTIVAANPQAQVLTEHGRLASALQALFIDARLKGTTVTAKMALQSNEAEGARRFDLVLLPLPCGDVLVIAREVTLEANLTSALAASRELFRDLALCFNDFAFETDAAGLFTWASPEGVLGWSSNELHGARVRDILGDVRPNPFSTREVVKALEAWVATKSGEEACVSVTASPVLNAAGVWCGTRGVARNVTALKLQERAAAHVRKRDELIAAVVNAVRAQVEPRRMMLAAADALAAATESDFVSIKALGTDLFASVGVNADAVQLAAAASYQGKPNGNVALARGKEKGAYGEAEKALLDAVLPHLGIALALVRSLQAVEQSRLDPATGLLNRCGFVEEVKRRLAAAARAARQAALVVIDCGRLRAEDGASDPAAYDAFLVAVARVLRSKDRAAGRLSDDVVAVFIDAAHDIQKIEAFVCERLDDLRKEFGLQIDIASSMRIAVAEAESGEDPDDLIKRAERVQPSVVCGAEDRVARAWAVQEGTSC